MKRLSPALEALYGTPLNAYTPAELAPRNLPEVISTIGFCVAPALGMSFAISVLRIALTDIVQSDGMSFSYFEQSSRKR